MTTALLVPDLPREGWHSMDRYASRLAKYLPAELPEMDVRLAGPIGALTEDDQRSGNGPQRPSSEIGRYVDRYLRYPRRVRRQPADLLHVLDHSYAHMLRVKTNVPRVVTVHDLLPLLMVQRRARTLRAGARNVLLNHVLRSLRLADAWIVSTEWLRRELADWLGRAEGIHVVAHGVDDAFFDGSHELPPATRERLGIPQDRFVVLHVGSVVERKNVAGVLAAVDGARDAGIPVWLLQVGGQFTPAQREEIAVRGLDDIVTQVPGAAEPDLRAAYRAADVLLFPSHYEGFGLPLLEAMASGLPVVTSGAAALAEVAGDAAVVVAGRDPEPYVEALTRLARDPAWRDTFRARGSERARRYRWVETARQTAEVYRGLL